MVLSSAGTGGAQEPSAAAVQPPTSPSVMASAIAAKQGNGILLRRCAAMWIDFLMVGIVAIGLLAGALQVLYGEEVTARIMGKDPLDSIYVWIWPALLYYFVLEGLTGFTVGKYILRIRIVKDDWSNPGLIAAFWRTILRLFEVNPILLGGLPAWVVAASSKKRQRIGDMLAKTYVVLQKDVHNYRSLRAH